MDNESEHLKQICDQAFLENQLLYGVLSSPKQRISTQKIIIRPLLIKEKLYYQITEFENNQARHQNLLSQDACQFIVKQISAYKQTILNTTSADYQILSSKKDKLTILKKAPTKSSSSLIHNRKKHYLLEEGTPIPFLIELGVINREGKVYPQKVDKFRQINRFLEMIEDVLPHFKDQDNLRIIDFGCGKAYLTFALYHYLKMNRGYALNIIGLDLKESVIKDCQLLADRLGYQELKFILGDINTYQNEQAVDMVISLHACDTATDAALEKAIRWQASVILAVPCCQHELFTQVENQALNPLLKHGILKERFSALVTDAARAQLLEICGYQTQVMEFIDLEHTPKNLLIRAIKKAHANPDGLWQSYKNFKDHLHINPSLEKRLINKLSLK